MGKLGISIYPERSTFEKDKAYLDLAHKYGYKRVFTSLLQINDDKEKVLSDDVKSESDINDIIDECSKDLDITVTDDQKAQIAELMQKINKLDLNVNDLKEQASKIYDKLSDMDIDTQGIFEKIKTALSSIFAALSGLFN